MTQLYIGNLPDYCSEDFLQHRFNKHGKIKEILLKGKFAFLEYEETKAADVAIKFERELLDSTEMIGLDVELANKQVKPVKGPVTLHLLNIPRSLNWEKLRAMLNSVGHVQKAELVDDGPEGSEWKRGIMTYELKEDAQSAIDRFHEANFDGTRLQIICPDPGPNSPLKQEKSRMRKASSDGRKKLEESSFPVRMVVPSNMIGAIIGKEGKTIRKITDTTGARVDIHRKENAHSLKKEITVFGNAETCNMAISMILKIMQDERATLSKPTTPSYKMAVLELLAHNDLLIKIFGPDRVGLRDLMMRSNTTISIMQSDELGKKAPQDRHIVIQGTPEDCCRAQKEISEMYNAAFESDMQRIVQMTQGGPGLSSQMSPPQHQHTPYMNSYQRQMNQRAAGAGTMPAHVQRASHRYSVDNQMYGEGKMMTSPGARRLQHPGPGHSPNSLIQLLAELQARQSGKSPSIALSDYEREQVQRVLSGQLAGSQEQYPSPPQPSLNYQKHFSTPKQPILMQDSPYTLDHSQSNSPFRYPRNNERTPTMQQMKQHHYPEPKLISSDPKHYSEKQYQESRDTFNMMGMLEGLDLDMVANNADDSGYQASPFPRNARHLDNYLQKIPGEKSARQWQGEQGGNYLNGSTGESPYASSTDPSPYASSTAPSPDDIKSFMNGFSYQNPSDAETSDFLSNSLLRPGNQWSATEDATLSPGNSITLENSNLRRELQSEYNADKGYPNGYQGASFPAQSATPTLPSPYGNQQGANPPSYNGTNPGNYNRNYEAGGESVGNMVTWNSVIRLDLAQKIDSVKTGLEQITRTKISLSQDTTDEKRAIIRAVGIPEGIQNLQQRIHMVQPGM